MNTTNTTPSKSEKIYVSVFIAFVLVCLLVAILRVMSIKDLVSSPFGITIIVLYILPIVVFFLAAIGVVGKNEITSCSDNNIDTKTGDKISSVIFAFWVIFNLWVWRKELLKNFNFYYGLALCLVAVVLVMTYFVKKHRTRL